MRIILILTRMTEIGNEKGRKRQATESVNPTSGKKTKRDMNHIMETEIESLYRCDICKACFKSLPLVQKHCLGPISVSLLTIYLCIVYYVHFEI